ncbi:hypothetical protein U9M48_013647 [Paspalum notatum var. saurae]|uniref:Uncharacterized protein n=1 Tax=Paspalum notatum var. saurae TaxID=547442 RepID=A0AAQ3WJR6_PASNO
MYTIIDLLATPFDLKTSAGPILWWAAGNKLPQLARQVGVGVRDPQIVMGIYFHASVKSQSGEIFSFGAFTSVVDKNGNVYLVHGWAAVDDRCESTSQSPPMDWRPFDGLEVTNEKVSDGLRQNPSNGLEAKLGVGRPWEFGTRRGGIATAV